MRESDRAYRAIIDQILSGKLRCGQPIVDERLQKDLQVGKTPLREALFRLIQDGYVTDIPHRGMSIASFDVSQLDSMLDLRLTLMSCLSERLVRNAHEEDIARCEQELHALIQMDSDMPVLEVSKADLRFHAMLGELCADNILTDILRKLEFMSSMALVSYFQEYYQNKEEIKQEYFEIFDLIRRRDRDALEAALKRHIPRYVLQRS